MSDPVFFKGDEVREVRPFRLDTDFEPAVYIRKIGDDTNASLILITETFTFDDIAHSIKGIGLNAEFNLTEWKVSIDELTTDWERVYKGEEVRKEQQLMLMGKVQQQNRDMQLLAERKPMPPPLLLTAPETPEQAESIQAAQNEYKQELTLYMADIQVVSNAMQKTTTQLTNVMSEQKNLLEAQYSDAKKQIAVVDKAVYSLKSFTLDHTETHQIAKGEPAPKGSPLTLYQRLLYIDEEFMVHAELSNDREHHRDPGMMLREIEKDPNLLQRLIPAQRGAVLMQFSRSRERYTYRKEEINFWEAMRISEEMQADKARILITRDGQNVHFTYIPEAIHCHTDSLFPKERDFDAIFGKELKFTDFGYIDARKKFEDKALGYRRLLLTIAGLQLKEKIFGDITDVNPMSLTKAAYHSEHIVYVKDAEEGLLNNMMHIDTWLNYVGKGAVSGDLILLNVHTICKPYIVPALGSYDEDLKPHFPWRYYAHAGQGDWSYGDRSPKITWLPVRIEGPSDDPYCTLEFVYTGDKRNIANKRARVYINREEPYGLRDDYPVSYLRMDFVTDGELQYYYNSRNARADFHRTHPILKAMLDYKAQFPDPQFWLNGREKGAALRGTKKDIILTKRHEDEFFTGQRFDNSIERFITYTLEPDVCTHRPENNKIVLSVSDNKPRPTTPEAIYNAASARLPYDDPKSYTYYKEHRHAPNPENRGHSNALINSLFITKAKTFDIKPIKDAMDALNAGRIPEHPAFADIEALVAKEVSFMRQGKTVSRGTMVFSFGLLYSEDYNKISQMYGGIDFVTMLWKFGGAYRDWAHDHVWNWYANKKQDRVDEVKKKAEEGAFRLGWTTIKPTLDNLKTVKPSIKWSEDGVWFSYDPYRERQESDEAKARWIDRALTEPYLFKPIPPREK